MASLVEPFTQRSGPLQGVVKIAAANQHIGQRGVRWIVHPTAKPEFLFVEADEVVAGGILDRIVILKIGLENHLTGRRSASGTAGDLSEELKGALSRTEVGKAQGDVGSNHANQGDAVDVVALGDHLGAYDQVELAFVEGVQRTFKIFVPVDCVAVEAGNACLGKHSVHQFFQLL